jgi:tRNA modification GTPase
VHLDLGGYPVTLRDTAGIRPTDDPVEQEGVRRAQRSADASDLVLWVLDGIDVTVDAIRAAVEQSTAGQTQSRVLLVVNKVDLLDAQARGSIESTFSSFSDLRYFLISAETGEGIDHLFQAIATFAGNIFGGEPAMVTRQRHRQMMDLAATALAEALALAEASGADGREELIAEQVRMATRALERLTGRVDVEDILDVIFRDFCIGK